MDASGDVVRLGVEMRFERVAFCFLLLLYLGNTTSAEVDTWSLLLARPGGDSGYSAIQDKDGNIFVSGRRRRGNRFGFLIKVGTNGNVLWKNEYSKSAVRQIYLTKDQGVIAAENVSVAKFDKNGHPIWANIFGADPFNNFFIDIRSIRQTADKGYVVVGRGRQDPGIWIAKLNSSGGLLWQRAFSACDRSFEQAEAVLPTRDGGFLVGGNTTCSALQDPVKQQLFVLKFSSGGKIQWRKEIGTPEDDNFLDLQPTKGGFVILGWTTHGNLLVEMDSVGNEIWRRGYSFLSAEQIRATLDGGFIVVGGKNLMKLNSVGQIEWQKRYQFGIYSTFHSVLQTKDDGYLTVGTAKEKNSTTDRDAWVAKFDRDGNIANQCVSINIEEFSETNIPFVIVRAKKLRRIAARYSVETFVDSSSILNAQPNQCR